MNDLISRQAAFDEIIWNSDNGVIDAKVAIEALRKLPSVEPERKPGTWQEVYAETDYRNGWIEFTCENCEYQHGLESGEYNWHFGDPIPWQYCPMCGAKMEGKK